MLNHVSLVTTQYTLQEKVYSHNNIKAHQGHVNILPCNTQRTLQEEAKLIQHNTTTWTFSHATHNYLHNIYTILWFLTPEAAHLATPACTPSLLPSPARPMWWGGEVVKATDAILSDPQPAGKARRHCRSLHYKLWHFDTFFSRGTTLLGNSAGGRSCLGKWMVV